jgi:transposase
MAKRGRPAKYRASMADEMLDMFREGQSVVEVCAALGISRVTFYQWLKDHHTFSAAYDRGLELSQAWWEKLGREGAAGKADINPATWIFNMKNRFRWTDRQDVNVLENMNVSIGLPPSPEEAEFPE